MMIDTGEGRLVLVDDRFFDAQVYPNRPKVLVEFRVAWVEWETLWEGLHYFVFDNTPDGQEALLERAIAEGYSIESGQLKLQKALGAAA